MVQYMNLSFPYTEETYVTLHNIWKPHSSINLKLIGDRTQEEEYGVFRLFCQFLNIQEFMMMSCEPVCNDLGLFRVHDCMPSDIHFM